VAGDVFRKRGVRTRLRESVQEEMGEIFEKKIETQYKVSSGVAFPFSSAILMYFYS
jgi:hypothetical protein